MSMKYNHDAIRRAYPNVAVIIDDTGVFDADGNPVEIDQAVVDAEAPAAALEIALKNLRAKRDFLLSKTDWWVLPDRTATAEQLAYRQALRDLPANTTDPANPVWPTKP